MSLYLCIFDDDEEIDGVSVGAYSDFGNFRDAVVALLEGGNRGNRFPVLMLHSDCDGEWGVSECAKLEVELSIVSRELKQLPPAGFSSDWQKNVAKQNGLRPVNLYDCFIDVDGEPLMERLLGLVKLAQARQLPIIFQ